MNSTPPFGASVATRFPWISLAIGAGSITLALVQAGRQNSSGESPLSLLVRNTRLRETFTSMDEAMIAARRLARAEGEPVSILRDERPPIVVHPYPRSSYHRLRAAGAPNRSR